MASPVQLAWGKAENIVGWLYRGEAELLWELCEAPWCEVGSHRGRSAVMLAERAQPGWCIDWFLDREDHLENPEVAREIETTLRANLAPYEGVTILSGRFQDLHELVPDDLAFLHLDADHSTEGTDEAFQLYAPKVRRGGYMVIHDAWHESWHDDPTVKNHSAWPGVTRFVNEILLADQSWEHVKDVQRSAAFRKR